MANAGAEESGGSDSSQPARSLPPPPPLRLLTAPWLLLWLLVAAAVPILVALLGVFARYLQVTTTPPFPALRFTSALNLLALPTLLLFHTLPTCLLRCRRRRQQRQDQGRPQRQAAANLQAVVWNAASAAAPHSLKVSYTDGSTHSRSSRQHGRGGYGGSEDGSSGSSKLSRAAVTLPAPAAQHMEPADSQQLSLPPVSSGALSGAPSAVLSAVPSAVPSAYERGPSLPGLAGLHKRHPAAHRVGVLLVAAACYEVAILGQNVAPGLVDPAVVMLVSMFTVVGVALLARLWLQAPLQWVLVVPAAAVMIGGAAMVLVPDILAGAGEPGSLTTGRAWLGFAASAGAMLGNTLFIVLAQAYRDTNLGVMEVQYTIIAYNLLLVLPISLLVDGTDWSAQFSGMTGQDWAYLIFCGCVAHAWIAILIQASTVRLGGLTVSMFFGLRLIGSVVGSKVVLGVTVVQTGVQVGGTVLVAFAITAYTAVHWRWGARQAQLGTADAAHQLQKTQQQGQEEEEEEQQPQQQQEEEEEGQQMSQQQQPPLTAPQP